LVSTQVGAGPLAGEAELVATSAVRTGDDALYSGVVGDPATLATLAGIAPLDQLAWWRFLFRVDDRTFLLPFVDASTGAEINTFPGDGQTMVPSDLW
jgi:hypothetical protein